jgi:hypothetical protein
MIRKSLCSKDLGGEAKMRNLDKVGAVYVERGSIESIIDSNITCNSTPVLQQAIPNRKKTQTLTTNRIST